MTNRKRIYAWILCFGFVLTLFVSSAYIVHEADHDCIGEGCDICETIALTEALLHSFVLLGVVLLFLFAAWVILKHPLFLDAVRRPKRSTLVSWKVRLNN